MRSCSKFVGVCAVIAVRQHSKGGSVGIGCCGSSTDGDAGNRDNVRLIGVEARMCGRRGGGDDERGSI